MSQVSIIDIEGNHPEIPTQFDANVGFAIPIANVLEILAEYVVAGVMPAQTVGSGNTITTQIQLSQAIAASNVLNVGLAAFDSADFTVDANGFVSFVGTGATETLTGNSGVATPVANNINVITANSTVKFVGAGNTLTQDFGLTNLMLGANSASITSAARNVGVGLTNLNPITSGTDNTGIGYNALKSVTTSSLNTAVGAFSQQTVSTGATANTSLGYATLSANIGSFNTALGYSVLTSCLSGSNNCGVGQGALGAITTGTYNIGIGGSLYNGSALTGSNSFNIMIGHDGIVGDNNTTRIGTQSPSTSFQNKCFIAGINGVTTSNSLMVTIDSTTGQLGVATISGGTVTSVSGTTDRITISGTAVAPIVDIAATYVGQTSITTLGTIGTGTWNATIIALNKGGTNAALTASNGGIFYSDASAGAILAGNATASKMLLSGASAAPTWSTSTIPSSAGATANKMLVSDGTNYVLSTPTFPNASATSGKIIISDGTNWIASTPTYPNSATSTGTILRATGTNWAATTSTYPDTNAISTLLYASAANVLSALATANSGILATNGSGVPSITAASGNWLNTSRSAFLGNLNSAALNKTGTGTSYTFGTDALTEIFDQGGDFTTAGVFTAPVTGKYSLFASIVLTGCTINANTVVTIVTSNRSYLMANGHGVTAQDNGCSISALCDMDVGDTATVTVAGFGEAGNTNDIAAGSKFSGHLTV